MMDGKEKWRIRNMIENIGDIIFWGTGVLMIIRVLYLGVKEIIKINGVDCDNKVVPIK